jgi:phytoene synthase
MCALYAVARRIDDIGDGDAPAPEKLEALAEVRKDLAGLEGALLDPSGDPVLAALADVGRHFPIPMRAFDELIEGCEMDVLGSAYGTFDDLVGYCRRVAGTVGRLSLAVYGCDEPESAGGLADDLGGPVDNLVALIAFEAARAEEWYERGLRLLPMLDWRSRACTAAMAGIYRQLLTAIQRDPASVLRARLSLPAWQKAGVAARALARGRV